jgi:UDP-2-acetamido-3-amino-2,3-dideoxy-glucuronate N-acetyltransferase
VINPRSAIIRKDEYSKTIVRKGASIGANATIVCGYEIGEYAFIGAGAVVTKTVLPFALVTGNPARHRGWVSKAGHKLHFEDGRATCPETGEQYILENDQVRVA